MLHLFLLQFLVTYANLCRSQKLIHRVDALRFPHYDSVVKERGRPGARAISAAFARERNAHHTGRNMNRRKGAGGANRDRTDDLLLAKQALSQLSYGPNNGGSGKSRTSDLTLIRGAL